MLSEEDHGGPRVKWMAARHGDSIGSERAVAVLDDPQP